jgi:hypothetical protein
MVIDDFEDGDLLDPEWTGDTGDFVVEGGKLQLMADGAGTSTLAVRLPAITAAVDSFAVEFLVEMDFAPSASNYCVINLENASRLEAGLVSGTELRFGGISGDQDALSLNLVDIDAIFGTIDGAAGALGAGPAVARFRLTFSPDTGYELLADYTGGTDFVSEGTINTDIFPDFDLLQIQCFYTASRADKFSFDDLNGFLLVQADDTPPMISGGEVVTADEVRLFFSEPIGAGAIENPANYNLSLAGLGVSSADLSGNSVTLTLSDDIPLQQDFTITIAVLQDEAGNITNNEMITLRYEPVQAPAAGNLVITEFMPDPNPTIALPDAEYVEIHNPTNIAVTLEGLGLASGGSPVEYNGSEILSGGAYVAIVDASDAADFQAAGIPFIAISSFPSLTNSGDEITLEFGGQVLQQFEYSADWYNDVDRDGGGYSIEYVGVGADAGCSGSWRASLSDDGGTPGRENSVTGLTPDATAPIVNQIGLVGSTVTISFTETIDPAQFNLALFSLDNGGTISSVDVLDATTVQLSTNIAEGIIYTLTIFPDFSDCSGNFPEGNQTYRLAVPAEPAAGDVVINEILFNPGSGGSDFLELYNCSDKVFQIEGWLLRNEQSTSQSTMERTIGVSRLFLPGDYLTLTNDPEDIQNRYLMVDPSLLVPQTLPSLPDDEGNISVIADGIILDAFDYNEDFHSALIGDEDGVSLERLRQKSVAQDANNWYSAAQSENFATPTRPNSQQQETLPQAGDQAFSVVNTTFSPDGDSFEDFLELQYVTERPGFLARIRIFDAQGRAVKTLRQVELLAGSGTIRWDGSNDEGRRARAGIYVLFVELFNPDGEAREEKLTAVLAGGL